MRRLLQDAEGVLDTAFAGAAPDSPSYAICLAGDGAIHMLATPTGWNLSALAAYHGADSAFLVDRRGGRIRVDGWSRGETCTLIREIPGMAQRLRQPIGLSYTQPRLN